LIRGTSLEEFPGEGNGIHNHHPSDIFCIRPELSHCFHNAIGMESNMTHGEILFEDFLFPKSPDVEARSAAYMNMKID
jgi:hypothetical protein